MLVLAVFAVAYTAFALLALGQARHAEAVAGAGARPRPWLAGMLLATALGLAVWGEGWGFGLLLWATLVTIAATAVVATLTWRPHWLRPLLPRPTNRRTDPMNRLTLGVLLLAGSLAQPAAAHMVWLERDGPTVQLYFGEPGDNLREPTGATLDFIAGPRLVGATAPLSRQPDHVAFGPLPPGDARVAEDSIAPRDDRQRGGKTRGVYLAREGRQDTTAGLELELVPTTPGGETFTLMFRGQPLPRATVEVIAPPGWTRSLRTDAEGRVTMTLPWAGRYVAEVQHLQDEAGGEGPAAFNRTRYVATLSFVAAQGIPWAAIR